MGREYKYQLLLHIDSDDPRILDRALGNANNFLKAMADQATRLVIVVNGPGVKLITTKYPLQAQKASDITGRGASIMVCANALTANDIGNSELWPGVEIVSSGIVEIVRLQTEGMAYVKP